MTDKCYLKGGGTYKPRYHSRIPSRIDIINPIIFVTCFVVPFSTLIPAGPFVAISSQRPDAVISTQDLCSCSNSLGLGRWRRFAFPLRKFGKNKEHTARRVVIRPRHSIFKSKCDSNHKRWRPKMSEEFEQDEPGRSAESIPTSSSTIRSQSTPRLRPSTELTIRPPRK